jgi:hypothetical protein
MRGRTGRSLYFLRGKCGEGWFYYQGRNWARLAVIFASVLIFLNNYGAIKLSNPIVKVVDASQMIVAVFLVISLNTSTAKIYFNRDDQRSVGLTPCFRQ